MAEKDGKIKRSMSCGNHFGLDTSDRVVLKITFRSAGFAAIETFGNSPW